MSNLPTQSVSTENLSDKERVLITHPLEYLISLRRELSQDLLILEMGFNVSEKPLHVSLKNTREAISSLDKVIKLKQTI